MKVSITNESKKVITMAEIGAARAIVRDMADDASTVKDVAASAVNCIMRAVYGIGAGCVDVLRCSAEIASNCRIWDYFSDGSGYLDVWINGVAETSEGFCKFGAYLSDIWSIGGENNKEIAARMYYRLFSEKK